MAGTFQVVIAPAARQDLKDIIDYVTENESYDRAVTVHNEIIDTVEGLEQMPGRHAPVKETHEFVGNYYRRATSGKYSVIFTIEERVAKVFVIRIMHVRRGTGFVQDALL